jgi:DNA polymerase III epsilon subunit-like protein
MLHKVFNIIHKTTRNTHNTAMYLIIDLETTGIPRKRKTCYTVTSVYDSSRIVSAAWVLLDSTFSEVSRGYVLIKPDNFTIPVEAQNIHGISTELAVSKGVDFDVLANHLRDCLRSSSVIVSHNIEFDARILMSELYRRNYLDILDCFKSKKMFCTMETGKGVMQIARFPKLIVLYEYLFQKSMNNAMLHNAYWDTEICKQCFIRIIQLGKQTFVNL